MKTILLFDSRFPERAAQRLTVLDDLASAMVRSGAAAAANPAEAGALSAGGALDPGMLTEVVLQHGANSDRTSRVMLPYSVVLVGAGLGVLAAIGTPIAGTPPAIPVNTALPTITGTAQEGQVLTASTGAWSNSPTSFAYQWKRGGAAIANAVNATRTLTAADVGAVMTCTVTATNASGSADATSAATAAVIAAAVAVPANTVAPAVTGMGTVGQTLATTNGTWTGSPTSYAYQWRRDGVDIAGATASTYTLVSADAGKSVTCRVSATNAGGSAGSTSNAVAVAAVEDFTSFYTMNGATMTATKSARSQAQAGTRRWTALGVGDSTSVSDNYAAGPVDNTKVANSWMTQMAPNVQAKMALPGVANGIMGAQGKGIAGVQAADPNVVITGAVSAPGGQYLSAVGGSLYQCSGGAGTIRYTLTSAADTVDCFYQTDANAANGTWTVTLTVGGTTTTLGSLNCNQAVAFRRQRFTFAKAPAGSYITFTRQGGDVYFQGCDLFDSTAPGIGIMRGGWSNSKTSDWNNTNNFGARNCIKLVAPDTTFILLGLNDLFNNVSDASTQANVAALIADAKLSGDVVVMTFNPCDASKATVAAQQSKVNAIKAAASAASVPVIDLWSYFVSWQQMVAKGYGDDIYYIHPNASGEAKIAEIALDFLSKL